MAEFDEVVKARLPETGHSRAEFEWADKITRLCDNVAFHFSFEIEQELTAKVCARAGDEEETAVSYHVQSPGQIIIDPWPFTIPAISGMIIGYEEEGYPDVLKPVVVPFVVNGR
jgi:hypothetical protein